MSTFANNSPSVFFTPSSAAQNVATTPTAPTQPNFGDNDEQTSFASVLMNAVGNVEQMHTSAQQQVTQLAQGDRQDIHNVMIAVEKADVAFQLMMQVRNKIVNAYQEVSRMQF